MKLNVERLFGKVIAERGYDYYKEGRVSKPLKTGNVVTAFVQGSHRYKVSINLETDAFRCNCPYDGMCKHLAALCYALNNRKSITSVGDIEQKLAKRSKEELVHIVREMLAQEPNLSRLLLSKEEQIKRRIKDIDTPDADEDWREFYDYIPDRIEEIIEEISKTTNRRELLFLLLKEVNTLNDKYDHHGSTEDSILSVLEELQEEKAALSKKEAGQVEKQIKDVLGSDYEEFNDAGD